MAQSDDSRMALRHVIANQIHGRLNGGGGRDDLNPSSVTVRPVLKVKPQDNSLMIMR